MKLNLTKEQVEKANEAQKKCCETCRFCLGDEIGYCAQIERPLVDFLANGRKFERGDPAKFWCNYWKPKENGNETSIRNDQ